MARPEAAKERAEEAKAATAVVQPQPWVQQQIAASRSVQQQMLDAQASFMAEHEPDDLNKRNTLDGKHTHMIEKALNAKDVTLLACTGSRV